MQVPLSCDLANVIELLRGEYEADAEAEVFVSSLAGSATITARVRAADASRRRAARARASPASPPAAPRGRDLRVTQRPRRGGDDMPSGARRRRARGRGPPPRQAERGRHRPRRAVRHSAGARPCRPRRGSLVQGQLLARVAPAGDDRPELVRLRGGRLAARLDPGRAEPPARCALADQPLDGEGRDRDRGPALLRARRRRLRGASRAPPGAMRRRAGSSRAARRSRSSSSATSTSRASGRSSGRSRRPASPIKLSKHWSKDRILAAWMNQVYFGNHAYGVEAAAQTYFSKPAKDLGLMQAALLAGLPQAPSLYDPILHPDAALARRDRRAEGAVRQRRHLVLALRGCASRPRPAPRPRPALHADPRAVLLQLRP